MFVDNIKMNFSELCWDIGWQL